MVPCNNCYSLLPHKPVSVDWLYCVHVSRPKFGSLTKAPLPFSSLRPLKDSQVSRPPGVREAFTFLNVHIYPTVPLSNLIKMPSTSLNWAQSALSLQFSRSVGHDWATDLIWSVHVSSLAQSCMTLCHSIDCTPPGSSVHEILLATILEGVAIFYSRGYSWSWYQTCGSCISCIGKQILYHYAAC